MRYASIVLGPREYVVMTQTEQSVLFVKPEAVLHEERVLEQLKGHDFVRIQRIGEREVGTPDAEGIAQMLYPNEPQFAKAAYDHLWNHPVLWFFVEAPRAIETLSQLVGTNANPALCRIGTLRSQFFARDQQPIRSPSMLNDETTGLNFDYHFNGFSCPRTKEECNRWFASGALCKTARAA